MSPTQPAPQTRVPTITTPAHTLIQHYQGRSRQSTSRIGPRKSTFRVKFTSATKNYKATSHSNRLCNISKGGAHPLPTRHVISKGGTTATMPNSQLHPSAKHHLSQVRCCGKLHSNRRSQFCQSTHHRSSPRIPSPNKGQR